jgi:hypothetical protein
MYEDLKGLNCVNCDSKRVILAKFVALRNGNRVITRNVKRLERLYFCKDCGNYFQCKTTLKIKKFNTNCSKHEVFR